MDDSEKVTIFYGHLENEESREKKAAQKYRAHTTRLHYNMRLVQHFRLTKNKILCGNQMKQNKCSCFGRWGGAGARKAPQGFTLRLV